MELRHVALALISLAGTAVATAAVDPGAAGRQVAAADPKAPSLDALHAPWSALLARHVRGGEIDYAALKRDRAPLDAYVASLEGVTPERLEAATELEQLAFWIDVHNAYTVRLVVDGYPVASFRDLGDEKTSAGAREIVPLGRLFKKLAKDKLSLDDVENRILRAEFRDARVHAAIHGAARGSAAPRAEAFSGAKLDAQLDEQVAAWLGDPSRNVFDREHARIEISRVFEWFAEDFQRDAGGVRAWIARRRPVDAAWLSGREKVVVAYVAFDWSLNDVQTR